MNVRQGRWLELLKDYDCDIHYHPGKANKVTDALSRKSTGSITSLRRLPKELQEEIEKFNLMIVYSQIATLCIRPLLHDQIREEQEKDEKLVEIRKEVQMGKRDDFQISTNGILRINGRMCIPNNEGIKRQLLEEAHQTLYSIHPGATKMYQDLKKQ